MGGAFPDPEVWEIVGLTNLPSGGMEEFAVGVVRNIYDVKNIGPHFPPPIVPRNAVVGSAYYPVTDAFPKIKYATPPFDYTNEMYYPNPYYGATASGDLLHQAMRANNAQNPNMFTAEQDEDVTVVTNAEANIRTFQVEQAVPVNLAAELATLDAGDQLDRMVAFKAALVAGGANGYGEAARAAALAVLVAAVAAQQALVTAQQAIADAASQALQAAIDAVDGDGNPTLTAANYLVLQTAQQTALTLLRVRQTELASRQDLVTDFPNGSVPDVNQWMTIPPYHTGFLDVSVTHPEIAGSVHAGRVEDSFVTVPCEAVLIDTGACRAFGVDVGETVPTFLDTGNLAAAHKITVPFMLMSDQVDQAGVDAIGIHAPVDELFNLTKLTPDNGRTYMVHLVRARAHGYANIQNDQVSQQHWQYLTYAGNVMKINHDMINAVTIEAEGDHYGANPQWNGRPNVAKLTASGMILQGLVFAFEEDRNFIFQFNDVGGPGTGFADRVVPSYALFNTRDCEVKMVNVGGSVWLCTEISKIYTLPQIVTPLQDVDTFFEHYKSMLLNKNYKDRSALPVPIQSIHNFWHRALGFTPTVQEFTVHLQQLHDNSPEDQDVLEPQIQQLAALYAGYAARLVYQDGDENRTPQSHEFSMIYLGKNYQKNWIGSNYPAVQFQNPFAERQAESRLAGAVFQSEMRVSQHICAPVLNPNRRIECRAPLNYDSLHLPPEFRDFELVCRDVKWDFLPGEQTLGDMILYEFNGGNQVVEATPSLLHLPQFRVFTTRAEDGTFDMEVFSPLGMPSYIACFARDADFSRDSASQPLIKHLSIMCNTTKMKSNTILDAGEHELYHMTQRNVHPRANFNRFSFGNRQVVLLSAEDIGMMGISEYQKEKRSKYRFSGVVDEIATVSVLLIYNNRGIMIKGRQLSVVRV